MLVTVAALSLTSQQASSQVRFHVNLNIGSQPAWGPAGYDYVNYYYLPDIDVYYSVPQRQFIYLDRGRWVFSSYLPARYRSYDLNRGYKVVVNEPRPYLHADVYRNRYSHYKGWRGRQELNERNERYNTYRRGNGNGYARGHDHDRRHDHH